MDGWMDGWMDAIVVVRDGAKKDQGEEYSGVWIDPSQAININGVYRFHRWSHKCYTGLVPKPPL
jgi:hypothetical protein